MLAPMNRVIIFVGDVEKCAGFFRDLFDWDLEGHRFQISNRR